MEDLFLKKIKCHVCQESFQSCKVRRSKYSIAKVDTDFCTHYKGENPLFYNIYICPFCGYGFSENFKVPAEKTRKEILEKITPLPGDYGQRRTLEMAVEAYKRAIECALIQKERKIILASLALHVAWFFRFAGKEEEEKKYLQEALNYYLEVYEKERVNGSLARIVYLIGELNRRLGKAREAIFWFDRVINDKNINDPGVIRMARERWQEIKSG